MNEEEEEEGFISELFLAVIKLFFGTIDTKIGLALFLIFIGIMMLVADVTDVDERPIEFVIAGWFLLLIGLFIMIKKVSKNRIR